MKNPVVRLMFYGILGLGVSTAMILENIISKRNTLWEYLISITLAIFSIVFLYKGIRISRKNK